MAIPPVVRETDISGDVAQFLLSVRVDDLIVEFVQNELDAGSSRTVIDFQLEAVVCEGNGRPVDGNGWKRLRLVKSVGARLEKRDGIGSKNYGLRVGFHLGNEISIKSDRKETKLLLCGAGSEKGFDPAAWGHPIPQPDAPDHGCRITIPYRRNRLPVPGREGFVLEAFGSEEIGNLFEGAVSAAPRRVIGAIAPGICPRYELEIRHWHRGSVVFVYEARTLPGWKGRTLFHRLCKRIAPDGRSETIVREEAHTFPIKLEGLRRRHVPKIYRGQRTIVGELSWEIDRNGRPIRRPGKLRYPLGYPDGHPHSYSELGLNISAPFVSDAPRHGTAEGTEKNRSLLECAEMRVPWILRRRLVPRFGPQALELIQPRHVDEAEVAKRLVLLAAEMGALPAASMTGVERHGSSAKRRRAQFRCVPAGSNAVSPPSFLITCYSWEQDRIDPLLRKVCPPGFPQLHSGTPKFVVKTLADACCHSKPDTEIARTDRDGPSVPYGLFDETDAILRMQPDLSDRFPWEGQESWQRDFGDPKRAGHYLDVVSKCLEHGKLDAVDIENLLHYGKLPNDQNVATTWNDLYWSRHPVPDIPGVRRSNVLHPDLASIKLFQRGPLALSPFDLNERLSRLNFEPVGVQGRRAFFDWLRKTPTKLKPRTLQAIATYPIWPTTQNTWVPLNSICDPASRKIASILDGHILRSRRSVLHVKGVSKRGHGALALRTVPSEGEIRAWYQSSTLENDDATLIEGELNRLDRFETDISTLRQDRQIRSATSQIVAGHKTIDGNRNLRPVDELHIATEAVKACGLLREDTTGGRHQRLYQSLGALTRPSSEALERALLGDASNQELLHRRIEAYVNIAENAEQLADRPIIRLPIRKGLYSPSELALPGKPDYWGNWKVKCNFPTLNPGREENLIKIGVTDRTPDWASSRGFFEWLSAQNEDVIAAHLVQVIRHFLHRQGPLSWWRQYSWIQCLPVKAQWGQIRLASNRDALASSSKAYLPDFPKVEDQMLAIDRWRSVAIVNLSNVSGTLLSKLKGLGVQSLRTQCGQPIRVRAYGAESRAPELEEILRKLTSSPLARELPKRIEEQDFPSQNLRGNWLSLLRTFSEVRVAEEVFPYFKLGHYEYRVDSQWAVDHRSSRIWIVDGANPHMWLFEAIGDIIFKDGTPVHAAYALNKAASMEFRTRVSPRRKKDQSREENDGTFEETSGSVTEKQETPSNGGEVSGGNGRKRVHGADDEFATPSPRRLKRRKQSEYKIERTKTRPKGSTSSTTGGSRRTSPQEDQEKQELKEQHYAWHCQACLGSYKVSEIAPRPTYGHHLRHRKPIIEAHHVHHSGKGGPLGAGNLLVLCQWHHQLLGDRMSQSSIRAKLRDEAATVNRDFPKHTGEEGQKRISGKVIALDLDVAPYTVKLFFTKSHAEIWQTDK